MRIAFNAAQGIPGPAKTSIMYLLCCCSKRRTSNSARHAASSAPAAGPKPLGLSGGVPPLNPCTPADQELRLPPAPPPLLPPPAAAAAAPGAGMVKGARCEMPSSGPYCPFASTLLLTLVRSSSELKACRHSRPRASPVSSSEVALLGRKLARVMRAPCWAAGRWAGVQAGRCA